MKFSIVGSNSWWHVLDKGTTPTTNSTALLPCQGQGMYNFPNSANSVLGHALKQLTLFLQSSLELLVQLDTLAEREPSCVCQPLNVVLPVPFSASIKDARFANHAVDGGGFNG